MSLSRKLQTNNGERQCKCNLGDEYYDQIVFRKLNKSSVCGTMLRM